MDNFYITYRRILRSIYRSPSIVKMTRWAAHTPRMGKKEMHAELCREICWKVSTWKSERKTKKYHYRVSQAKSLWGYEVGEVAPEVMSGRLW